MGASRARACRRRGNGRNRRQQEMSHSRSKGRSGQGDDVEAASSSASRVAARGMTIHGLNLGLHHCFISETVIVDICRDIQNNIK